VLLLASRPIQPFFSFHFVPERRYRRDIIQQRLRHPDYTERHIARNNHGRRPELVFRTHPSHQRDDSPHIFVAQLQLRSPCIDDLRIQQPVEVTLKFQVLVNVQKRHAPKRSRLHHSFDVVDLRKDWHVQVTDRTSSDCGMMDRAMGIEPTSEAWEASNLPLNYARSFQE
jgi:hypothetical protein